MNNLSTAQQWAILSDLEDGIGERNKLIEGPYVREKLKKKFEEDVKLRLELYALLAKEWGFENLGEESEPTSS